MRHDFEMLRSFMQPAILSLPVPVHVQVHVHVRGAMEDFMPKPAIRVTHESKGPTGQELAGKGELVFEGEVLEMPAWR